MTSTAKRNETEFKSEFIKYDYKLSNASTSLYERVTL